VQQGLIDLQAGLTPLFGTPFLTPKVNIQELPRLAFLFVEKRHILAAR